MRRPGLRAVVGVLTLLLLPLFGPSSTAAAKPMTDPVSTALPISYHADMAVDAVHRRLYMADIVTGSVLVTDFDGRLLRTLKNKPGAADLVLSPDSRTLYVALSGGDAIAAVDTGTYREKARYTTGDGTAPLRLALAGDTLWFSYGSDWDSNIGSLFRTGADTPSRVIDLEPGTGRWLRAHGLIWSPDGTRLFALTGEYGANLTLHVIPA
ncbi:YncE family protein [Streptomyces sp. NPDC054837]